MAARGFTTSLAVASRIILDQEFNFNCDQNLTELLKSLFVGPLILAQEDYPQG
jgi:hypothetical protein